LLSPTPPAWVPRRGGAEGARPRNSSPLGPSSSCCFSSSACSWRHGTRCACCAGEGGVRRGAAVVAADWGGWLLSQGTTVGEDHRVHQACVLAKLGAARAPRYQTSQAMAAWLCSPMHSTPPPSWHLPHR